MSRLPTAEEDAAYDAYSPAENKTSLQITCGPPNKIDLCLVHVRHRGEVIFQDRIDPYRSEPRNKIADAICRRADYVDDDGTPFDWALVEVDQQLRAAAASPTATIESLNLPVLKNLATVQPEDIFWLCATESRWEKSRSSLATRAWEKVFLRSTLRLESRSAVVGRILTSVRRSAA